MNLLNIFHLVKEEKLAIIPPMVAMRIKRYCKQRTSIIHGVSYALREWSLLPSWRIPYTQHIYSFFPFHSSLSHI